MCNLLDFDEETKKVQLAPQGWATDTTGAFDSEGFNEGWKSRRVRFLRATRDLKDKPIESPYFRSDPVTFVGRLRTNLEYCWQGLQPGTPWTCHIKFVDDNFPIWSSEAVDTDYMLQYTACRLYVPVGTLTQESINKIEARMASQASKYYNREMCCTSYGIREGQHTFTSPDILLPVNAGIKVYVALVKRSAMEGDQHQNPYDFRRMWIKTDYSASELAARKKQLAELEQRRLDQEDEQQERLKAILRAAEQQLRGQLQSSAAAPQSVRPEALPPSTSGQLSRPQSVRSEPSVSAASRQPAPPMQVKQLRRTEIERNEDAYASDESIERIEEDDDDFVVGSSSSSSSSSSESSDNEGYRKKIRKKIQEKMRKQIKKEELAKAAAKAKAAKAAAVRGKTADKSKVKTSGRQALPAAAAVVPAEASATATSDDFRPSAPPPEESEAEEETLAAAAELESAMSSSEETPGPSGGRRSSIVAAASAVYQAFVGTPSRMTRSAASLAADSSPEKLEALMVQVRGLLASGKITPDGVAAFLASAGLSDNAADRMIGHGSGGKTKGGTKHAKKSRPSKKQKINPSPAPLRPAVRADEVPINTAFDPRGDPDPYSQEHNYVYLKSINLVVNANMPDQFQGIADPFEAPMDYLRLQEVQGTDNRNVSNSITPTMFNRNFYIAAWNLSTAPSCNLLGIVPSVPQTSQLAVRLVFSDTIPCDLNMIVWTQFASGFSIDKHHGTKLSYYDVYNK